MSELKTSRPCLRPCTAADVTPPHRLHIRHEAGANGYAPEATAALIDRIFGTTAPARLAAVVLPDDRRTLAVLARLGFTGPCEGLYGSSRTLHRDFEPSRTDFEARRAAAGD